MSERAPEAGAPRGTPLKGGAGRSVSAQHPQLLQVAPVPQRARVVSVEAIDLVVDGREGLLLDGLHGDLVRAAAQLREGRPALAAFLQHLPVLEMPDAGHRLLDHALDLAAVRMLYILERRPTYSRMAGSRSSVPADCCARASEAKCSAPTPCAGVPRKVPVTPT